MFGTTQIVVVDDSEADLRALITGLNRLGAACLGIHYSNVPSAMTVMPCHHVRAVITDLNLLGIPPGTNMRQLFAAVAEVLQKIQPRGPYLLVAWTRLPNEAKDLQTYLDANLTDAAKPIDVVPLAKEFYIDDDGNVIDIESLVAAIDKLSAKIPTFAALCDWELAVLRAAGETLTTILELGKDVKTGKQQRKDITRLLAAMAGSSVGARNVGASPFRAVSDALMPILADQMTATHTRGKRAQVWREAVTFVGRPDVLADEAVRLNRAFHVADDVGMNQGAERGAVIPLPYSMSGANFVRRFGMPELQASRELFRCQHFLPDDSRNVWVLVQAQAACDYAQRVRGPLPFYLALDIESTSLNKDTPPQFLWRSPRFAFNGSVRELQVNTRIQVPMVEPEARLQRPLYRLREQLLAQLLHCAQANNSRPGIASF